MLQVPIGHPEKYVWAYECDFNDATKIAPKIH